MVETPGTGTPQVAEVPCVVCREPIRPGARKCVKCSSFQNWTRYPLQWSGVVGAVLALLPLWTMAVSLRELAFARQVADLRFSVLSCTPQTISVAVSNVGTQAGIMRQPRFAMVEDGRRREVERELRTAEAERVVKPGEVLIAAYTGWVSNSPADFPARSASSRGCRYQLTWPVTTFDAPAPPVEATCTCP
jgi:hypothetical protein